MYGSASCLSSVRCYFASITFLYRSSSSDLQQEMLRHAGTGCMQDVSQAISMVQHLRLQVRQEKLEQQSKRTRNAVLQATRHNQAAEVQKVTERCQILQARCHSVQGSTGGIDYVQVLCTDHWRCVFHVQHAPLIAPASVRHEGPQESEGGSGKVEAAR